MNPFRHPSCNTSLGPPEGMTEEQVHTLHIRRENPTEENPTPSVVSFWNPEPGELETLNSGGSVMLRILGTSHPPLSIRVSPKPDEFSIENDFVPFVITSDDFQSLSDEISELRADKARLDWMESHPLKAQIQGGSQDGGTAKAWAVSAQTGTLRETLDTLIAATPA